MEPYVSCVFIFNKVRTNFIYMDNCRSWLNNKKRGEKVKKRPIEFLIYAAGVLLVLASLLILVQLDELWMPIFIAQSGFDPASYRYFYFLSSLSHC